MAPTSGRMRLVPATRTSGLAMTNTPSRIPGPRITTTSIGKKPLYVVRVKLVGGGWPIRTRQARPQTVRW